MASIFRDRADGGTELLFIERAKRVGDPWSGHIAFPGGRVDPTDRDTAHTAARETSEEVGLDLDAAATHLGQLDDLEGRGGSRLITVSLHAWWLDEPDPPLIPNHEVEEAFWVDLDVLADVGNHIEFTHPLRPGVLFPGIDLGGRVLWGLTLRLIDTMFERFGRPLPVRPG